MLYILYIHIYIYIYTLEYIYILYRYVIYCVYIYEILYMYYLNNVLYVDVIYYILCNIDSRYSIIHTVYHILYTTLRSLHYAAQDRNWGVGGKTEFDKNFDCKNSISALLKLWAPRRILAGFGALQLGASKRQGARIQTPNSMESFGMEAWI